MEIEEFLNEARKSISRFCLEECNAYCCRKGYLIINKEEMDLICGNKKNELASSEDLKEIGPGKFSLHLGNPNGCPQLNGSFCNIHKNEKRPLACKEFPIFKEGNRIHISNRCPAKKENKFYKFIHDLEENGYTVD